MCEFCEYAVNGGYCDGCGEKKLRVRKYRYLPHSPDAGDRAYYLVHPDGREAVILKDGTTTRWSERVCPDDDQLRERIAAGTMEEVL